jgi:hypothetical protein
MLTWGRDAIKLLYSGSIEMVLEETEKCLAADNNVTGLHTAYYGVLPADTYLMRSMRGKRERECEGEMEREVLCWQPDPSLSPESVFRRIETESFEIDLMP